MTATIGVWLDHGAASYKNEGYKAKMRQEVQQLVATVKNHPAMLIYALGNETNSGADTAEAWSFINELATDLPQERPESSDDDRCWREAGRTRSTTWRTMRRRSTFWGSTATAGWWARRGQVEAADLRGPYIITEWGPHGHWEVPTTSWARRSSRRARRRRSRIRRRTR